MAAEAPSTAGFVLAGGRSSRMGRDKALLEIGGVTLLERAAAVVREAAGSATVIAPAGRYAHLGLPTIPDSRPGEGPLAGIEAALAATAAPWNLVVACDMPNLAAALLRELLALGAESRADCVVALSDRGAEPLLAAYHRRCLGEVRTALNEGVRKVSRVIDELEVVYFSIDNHSSAMNVNTPDEWRSRLG